MESDNSWFRILVVDDEESIRRMLEDVLEMDDYTTFSAESGDEAWEIFKEKGCDLIITDIEMPGTTGIDLLARVREQQPDMPVIIVTGRTSVEAAVECMKLGANDYIMKPINIAEFLAVVRKTLAETTAAREDGSLQKMGSTTCTGYRTIAGYRIVNKIGEGNKGIVFLASPVKGDESEKVAVKILRLYELTARDRDHALERFIREAEVATTIKHPNIVKILDYDTTDREEIPYIVMEYIAGRTLGDFVGTAELDRDQKLQIIRQVAGALEAIHSHDICHRDIKPGNIMIDSDFCAKVTDFGIAKLPESELTLTGDIVGTPYYLSPEGFSSTRVDQRSDIFSLGVVAYELLLGRRPYAAESIFQLAHVMSTTLPPAPRAIDPDFPVALERILARMLRKDPEHRYATAGDVVAALDAFFTGDNAAEDAVGGTADWAVSAIGTG